MSADHDKPNPDQLEGIAHPRQSTALFGHEEACETFLEAWQRDKLHHAWLMLGREGVGKATLAYHFAKRVLSHHEHSGPDNSLSPEFDPQSKDVQLIASEAHPNLLVLRRSWNTKTKKFGSQITVDHVRELQHFLGNTAGMGKWRVVIVDRADDLNMNAANALLKMLEEPPAFCLFLLVSSEPGKLPTTIRSRCQELRLGSLDEQDLKACVGHIAEQSQIALPDEQQLPVILKLAEGSVRLALEFASGRTLEDYHQIEKILDLLPRVDPLTTIALAERLAPRNSEKDYDSFLLLLSTQISNRIRQIVLSGGGNKPALAQWSELWETISTKKSETDLLNLDRGNFILDLFAHIEEVAGKAGGLKI